MIGGVRFKICFLLNPVDFLYSPEAELRGFRARLVACFETQLQPTTHPLLQHLRLFHMQITSKGVFVWSYLEALEWHMWGT